MAIEYPPPATNRAELIERIEAQRASLVALLSPLTAEEMTEPRGDWTLKDHIAHLTAWAGKAVALIQDLPAYKGLGLISPPADPRDYDSINAVLHGRDRSLPLEEVVARWGQRHGEVLAVLMLASDRDLRLPTLPGEPDGPSMLAAVANNTYEHSMEHELWIRQALARTTP